MTTSEFNHELKQLHFDYKFETFPARTYEDEHRRLVLLRCCHLVRSDPLLDGRIDQILRYLDAEDSESIQDQDDFTTKWLFGRLSSSAYLEHLKRAEIKELGHRTAFGLGLQYKTGKDAVDFQLVVDEGCPFPFDEPVKVPIKLRSSVPGQRWVKVPVAVRRQGEDPEDIVSVELRLGEEMALCDEVNLAYLPELPDRLKIIVGSGAGTDDSFAILEVKGLSVPTRWVRSGTVAQALRSLILSVLKDYDSAFCHDRILTSQTASDVARWILEAAQHLAPGPTAEIESRFGIALAGKLTAAGPVARSLAAHWTLRWLISRKERTPLAEKRSVTDAEADLREIEDVLSGMSDPNSATAILANNAIDLAEQAIAGIEPFFELDKKGDRYWAFAVGPQGAADETTALLDKRNLALALSSYLEEPAAAFRTGLKRSRIEAASHGSAEEAARVAYQLVRVDGGFRSFLSLQRSLSTERHAALIFKELNAAWFQQDTAEATRLASQITDLLSDENVARSVGLPSGTDATPSEADRVTGLSELGSSLEVQEPLRELIEAARAPETFGMAVYRSKDAPLEVLFGEIVADDSLRKRFVKQLSQWLPQSVDSAPIALAILDELNPAVLHNRSTEATPLAGLLTDLATGGEVAMPVRFLPGRVGEPDELNERINVRQLIMSTAIQWSLKALIQSALVHQIHPVTKLWPDWVARMLATKKWEREDFDRLFREIVVDEEVRLKLSDLLSRMRGPSDEFMLRIAD